MLLGLSWTAWLLIVLSIGPSLGIVLAFRLAHRDPGERAVRVERGG